MVGAFLRQTIRSSRRAAVSRGVAAASEKFLRAWYNEGYYAFDKNGERFAVSCFAKWSRLDSPVIWDVGAHLGHWADVVHEIMPRARITSFEILKPIADRVLERHRGADWFTLENIGLSDQEGQVEVTWNPRHDTTNSITPRLESKFFRAGELVQVPCRVTTLDAYAARTATTPDFLKIDVEGHEGAVLAGGAHLLSGERAPAMIQFEYGDTWIPGGHTLYKVQRQLEALGYSVGRLYPDHVAFKAYDYADEHFRMGNMIAVKDPKLRALLA